MLFWLILAAFVSYFLLVFYSKVRKYPPGPLPLPLIGNLPQLAIGMYLYGGIVNVFLRWQKLYGDVHTYWMGPLPVVNICDYHIAQDAMVKKGANFVDRTIVYFFQIERVGKGIVMANGEGWQEQRRFALHTLKNFGMGKNVMEERVLLEFFYRTELLDANIEKSEGRLSWNPSHFIELTIGNIINRILFTDRLIEEEEREFFRVKGVLDELLTQSSPFDLLLSETNKDWPIFKGRVERVKKPVQEMRQFVKGQIDKRKMAIERGEHELSEAGEDFVDAYLIEMKRRGEDSNFDEEALYFTLMDLWGAGLETTANTLHWALCYLVQNSEDMQRLQDELDRVTGGNRPLKLSDRPRTPFLNAIVLETLRTSSIIPINVLRETNEDTVVGGHVIPKGTSISTQISTILLGEKNFSDPLKFNPSRFLEKDTDQLVVVFGQGKRACLGESLARAELYLIIGNFFLRYNIAPNPQHPARMEAQSELGTVRKPVSFEVFISKRD